MSHYVWHTPIMTKHPLLTGAGAGGSRCLQCPQSPHSSGTPSVVDGACKRRLGYSIRTSNRAKHKSFVMSVTNNTAETCNNTSTNTTIYCNSLNVARYTRLELLHADDAAAVGVLALLEGLSELFGGLRHVPTENRQREQVHDKPMSRAAPFLLGAAFFWRETRKGKSFHVDSYTHHLGISWLHGIHVAADDWDIFLRRLINLHAKCKPQPGTRRRTEERGRYCRLTFS